MENESLVDKYSPENLSDIHGHSSIIKKVEKWGNNWSEGTEPLLFHGPAGTGKTSTAEAVANEFGWNYVEINASSYRSSEDIEKLTQQIRSKGENFTLFVLDEVDSINGNSLKPLYSVIESLPNPVICTANEKWKVPDGLENKCKTHKFKLKNDSIKSYLKKISQEEDIEISNRQIGQLATRVGIRDALNDLQEFAGSGSDTDWDSRQTDDSPFTVTRRILLGKDYVGDMTPDDMVAFLNENIGKEFDGVEAMRSYQSISEADKLLGHTNRTQDYSWWRYVGPLAEEVSNLRLTEPYNDWININYPSSRRNYTPDASSETKEAELYNYLKRDNQYSFSFNFQEFRKIILPMLESLSKEEKKHLVLSESIPEDLISVIGLTKKEFEDWEVEEKEEHDTGNTDLSDFIDDNEDEKEEKGLFDY
jgi:replication factor C large subunit